MLRIIINIIIIIIWKGSNIFNFLLTSTNSDWDQQTKVIDGERDYDIIRAVMMTKAHLCQEAENPKRLWHVFWQSR